MILGIVMILRTKVIEVAMFIATITTVMIIIATTKVEAETLNLFIIFFKFSVRENILRCSRTVIVRAAG